MRVFDIIKRKRDGKELSIDEIKMIIKGFTASEIPEYQMSALLMAIYLNGLNMKELYSWTNEMIGSGDIIDLKHINGYKVDKHSTGGVGDKVSIPLAPIVGACGVYVPMISGRGLGHTGGTLDKLESIPGFSVNINADKFKELVFKTNVCLAGQTEMLVPADRKLYALRDVTATVESMPLIASSIISKKVAEGIDGLVMDIKTGSGAFMTTMKDAQNLGDLLIEVGSQLGKNVFAFITDMNQPLGYEIGNALEIKESIEVLKGKGPEDITKLTFEIASIMIKMAKLANSRAEAFEMAEKAVKSGRALQKFSEIISAQGGDHKVLDDYSLLPGYSDEINVYIDGEGYISSMDTDQIGISALQLGAGREKLDSIIDPGVGITILKKIGDYVKQGEAVAILKVNSKSKLKEAKIRLKNAYHLSDHKNKKLNLIKAKKQSGESEWYNFK